MQETKPDIYYCIIQEAASLFRKHGIRFVTMDLIAENLGISKKTIYVHFQNKKEIIADVIDARLREHEKIVEKIQEKTKNTIEQMVMMMNHGIRQIDETNPLIYDELKRYYPKIYHLVKKSRQEDDYRGVLQMVEAGKREGLFCKDVESDIVTKLFLAQMELVTDHNLFPAAEYPKKIVFKHICINFLRGIATKKGIKTLDNLKAYTSI